MFTGKKNAYISKTVLDRAILRNFLNHRVSLHSSIPPKKFCLAENGGCFEFSNFWQKLQNTKKCLYLKNRAR